MGAMSPGRLAFGLIPWYSLIMVSAIALAVFICSREEKRLGLPKDTAIDSALWAIPFGIVGARLYYVIFTWDQFSLDLIRILYVWEGGVAIYGALLGGLLGVWINAHKKKIPLFSILDMVAPALLLAQALGRWGNYFNREAYGLTVTNPAWQFFPFAVLIPSGGQNVWHLATFFYESIWNMFSFFLLMTYRKRMYRRGDVFLWYVLLYGTGRAVVEGLRTDSLLWFQGTIRVSQWLSLISCGLVFLVLLLRCRKEQKDILPLLPGVAFLFLSYYMLYTGARMGKAFLHPAIPAAILALCVVGILIPLFKRKKIAIGIPLLAIALGQGVLLFFYQGGQDTLFMQTAFITLVSLGFPSAALAVYPYTKAA